MPTMWRVYSGTDGRSHLEPLALDMKPFKDHEGSYGEASPMQAASGIAFRGRTSPSPRMNPKNAATTTAAAIRPHVWDHRENAS